jgi:hypothetical protein
MLPCPVLASSSCVFFSLILVLVVVVLKNITSVLATMMLDVARRPARVASAVSAGFQIVTTTTME